MEVRNFNNIASILISRLLFCNEFVVMACFIFAIYACDTIPVINSF